ncbi:MAG: hypothetical protein ABID04_04305 [Patescibacteria group bacterium]
MILASFVFLLPLVFLPLLTDPVFTFKNFFLAFGLVLILIVAGIRLLKSKKLNYSLSSLDWGVALFLGLNLLSWFFIAGSGGKVRSLIQPMGLGTILLSGLAYFAVAQAKGEKKNSWILTALTASGLVAGLVAVVLFLLPQNLFPWRWVSSSFWSPTGSVFVLLQFLLPLFVFYLVSVWKQVSLSGRVKQWFPLAVGVILLVFLGVTAYQVFNLKPAILGAFPSWAITVEAFKRSPLFGIGPGGFANAFHLYRPIELNASTNWFLNFVSPNSWFLNVWAETGVLGLLSLLLLFFQSLRLVRKNRFAVLVLILWLEFLVLPGNLLTVFTLFIGLALLRGAGKEKSFSLLVGETGQDAAPFLVGILLFLGAGVLGYFSGRGLWGELVFRKSLVAASENRGADTYNLQQKTIQINRFLPQYRVVFSQTNLALANSLSAKEDLTDEEKTQISQLIQQSIDQAKAAVALETNDLGSWQNLAQIYQSLINAVSGAEDWALAAYQQLIGLSPTNPNLRVDFGGLLFGLKQYEAAARQFELAVNLKPDLANAWYNWAWSLKQQDRLAEAVARLQQAVSLVDLNSADYQKASEELDAWQKELGQVTETAQQETGQPTQLQQPQPIPSPKLEEPIVLPNEDEAAPELIEEVPQEVLEGTPSQAPQP